MADKMRVTSLMEARIRAAPPLCKQGDGRRGSEALAAAERRAGKKLPVRTPRTREARTGSESFWEGRSPPAAAAQVGGIGPGCFVSRSSDRIQRRDQIREAGLAFWD